MDNLFAPYEPHGQPEPGRSLPAGVVVRPAEPEDVQAMAAIAHQRQGGSLPEHVAKFERELSTPRDGVLLVALVSDILVAFGRAIAFRPGSDCPQNVCPEGWYLGGVVVHPDYRRLGIGRELTSRRLAWIAERAREAYFVVNTQNQASIDLHAKLGFEEVTRDFVFPGVTFTGGQGILYRAVLDSASVSGSSGHL